MKNVMKLIKYFSRVLIVVALALSITLNIALFVGGSIYKMASSAFGALSGIRTVAAQHADEVARLGSDLAQERAAKRQLRSELSDVAGSLASERSVTRKLRSELTDPLSSSVIYRGQKVALRDAVDMTATRISRRAVVTSSREVGAMAGEAMPYIGVAVIVGVTALELKDLCDTLKDMSELKRSMSLESSIGEDENTVCSIEPPTRQELWETAKASPEEAWSAARDAVPTLQELKDIEMPNIEWDKTWATASGKSKDAWEAAKSGAASAVDVSRSTGASAWESWFGESDESAPEDQ